MVIIGGVDQGMRAIELDIPSANPGAVPAAGLVLALVLLRPGLSAGGSGITAASC